MKINRKSNRIKSTLVLICCVGILLLGGCSDTEKGTWKQEYESCVAEMELRISELGMAGGQDLLDYERRTRDWSVELWQDSLHAFNECVEACARNQTEGGEEDIYRTAVFLIVAMCEERSAPYQFAYEHGEDMEKAQENFKAVMEKENLIDESISSLYEDFGIYYYADTLISEMLLEAWQEEFHHCLDAAKNAVKQPSAADQEQSLEILKAYEDFFEIWADKEEECKRQEFLYEERAGNKAFYEWIWTGGALSIWQAKSGAEIFRIGTMLLADRLEKSGVSYEILYNGETDKQELIDLLGVCPEADGGTWKQEYEICMAAMELGISRYDITGAHIPYENLPDYDRWASDKSMELWQDSLSAFSECVTVCIRNQTEGTEGEEEIYRMAVFLMKALCESRNGHYTLAHDHGENLEKAQEDFEAVIERENPIDECSQLFYEEFGSFYYADFEISAMLSEAWQEEFQHCLNLTRDRVKHSDTADQEQVLETLEAWEDFFEVWADNEEAYEQIEGGTGMNFFITESRAEVFRIGTMLLINGLEESGISYEFIYDSGSDRQELTEIYSE